MESAELIWVKFDEGAQLRYRHSLLAEYRFGPDAVAVTTRAYIEGYRPTIWVTSERVARRYIAAWMAKW